MEIIDISQEVLSCNVYPGDPKPVRDIIKSMESGELYNLSQFSMCAHNGTHIDAPCHFVKNGKAVDEISLDSVVGACFVFKHEGDVTKKTAVDILKKAAEAGADERILIAGDVTVTKEAAEIFALSKIRLLGNEGQTVGPEDAPMEVHQILLGADIVLLEGIVLENVSEGKYFLSAAPLNIKGIEGSVCRAYLIKM